MLPETDPSSRMTLELCIPAYNEADILPETLRRVVAVLEGSDQTDWMLTVVDNGSTDETAEVARAVPDPRIQVLRIDERGKGRAILHAAARSRAALFGFIDADLSADPHDLFVLLGSVTRGDADIAIGSRFLDRRQVRRGVFRSASSYLFNRLRRLVLGVDVRDSQCGLKVMNARACALLATCTETGWFLDLEFLARAERAGFLIAEVPVHWDEARFAGRKSKLHVFSDGIRALQAMLRIRLRLGSV